MNPRDNIRSVARTMQVLRALNRRPVGTVRELQRETGLPGPTLVRILGTLENLGYVRNAGRRVGYVLTGRVAELSAGWHGFPAIHGRAPRVLEGLTRRLLWPAALATLDGDAMTVRLSTIPLSPLAHTHSTLGRRLALAVTAHGRACLAFSPEEERRRLLALLAETARSAPHRAVGLRAAGGTAGLAARLGPTLLLTRNRGYAVRDPRSDLPDGLETELPGRARNSGTMTVAVPVMSGVRVVATIGITCFAGARTDRGQLAGELKAAAARIAAP